MDAPLNVDGIFTRPTLVTLSVGPSPRSASTDIGEDEGGIDDGRVEVMLWINFVVGVRAFVDLW
jgi:hypothetical protein